MQTPSSYLLLFRDASPAAYRSMSPEQRQQLLEQWNQWYQRLAAEGRVEHGRPLEPEGRVVAMRDGRLTDGPYAESKESVGGYFLLRVRDREEALAIARDCPGLPHGVEVEVRPVASVCPILRRMEEAAAHGASVMV